MKRLDQMMLEEKIAKNNLLPRILEEIGNVEDKNLKLFAAYLVIYKRVTPSTMIGLMYKRYASLQDCADAIESYLKAGYADWDEQRQQIVIKYDIPEEVHKELEYYQYPLPMYVEPEKCVTNKDSGYISIKQYIVTNVPFCKDDVNLDHINKVNSIPLELNGKVVHECKNKWHSSSEMSKKNFERYMQYAKDVCAFTLKQDKFYIMHRYDKRGRIYDMGYYVNPQGNDWNKAMIMFHNKEIVRI